MPEEATSGWKNGDTALAFIYDQMGDSVKAMQSSSVRIKKVLEGGFPNCPAEGVEFHRAIGDSAVAQNTAIAALTAWNQKHVARAIKVQQSNQRRATDDPTEVPELDYSGVFGHLVAKGQGSMKPFLQAIIVIALCGTVIYGIRVLSKTSDKMDAMKTMVDKMDKVIE